MSDFRMYLNIVATKQVKVEHKTHFLNNGAMDRVVAHSITALSQTVNVNVYVCLCLGKGQLALMIKDWQIYSDFIL